MKFLPVSLVVLLLAGCHAMPSHGGDAPSMAPTEGERTAALASADFSRATAVRIELRDQGFKPDALRLRAGMPYRLMVENIGGHAHYLNGPEFLRSIAARHVELRGEVEIEAPYFSRFEVAPRGGHFQLDFVPLQRGVYRVRCHLEGDVHRGVEGQIIVE